VRLSGSDHAGHYGSHVDACGFTYELERPFTDTELEVVEGMLVDTFDDPEETNGEIGHWHHVLVTLVLEYGWSRHSDANGALVL